MIKRRQQTGRAGIGCQEEITSVILLDDFDNISDREWVLSINTDLNRASLPARRLFEPPPLRRIRSFFVDRKILSRNEKSDDPLLFVRLRSRRTFFYRVKRGEERGNKRLSKSGSSFLSRSHLVDGSAA